jgi:hypothetical protein
MRLEPLINSRYKSKNDADEAVSVVSLTSSSGGYINGRNSANLELLIDKTSPIYLYVKLFEETKGVIRIRKSKDRQHNGQTKKVKCTNNDLQNTTQKTRNTNSTI